MSDVRRLILVLRDQLNPDAPVITDADPERDVIAMTEAPYGQQRFPEHKQRLALGFAAMRHFRDARTAEGFTVHYQSVTDGVADDVAGFLRDAIGQHGPERVVLTEPGRHGTLAALEAVADKTSVSLDVHADTHFLCAHRTFEDWAEGRKSPTMEYFYRVMRREYDVLLTDDGDPVGGDWNFDKQNRDSYGSDGPGLLPEPLQFEQDDVTQGALADVRDHAPDAYGHLDAFNWPVTPEQAETALDFFIEHHLPDFGDHQDAMWTGRPFLHHSRLSAAFNLKLLNPRMAIERAEAAYHDGHAPINAVEGFIRQLLGWREFVRGLYWLHMPAYAELNELDATADLPDFFWTGDTDMTCIRESVSQLKDYAYAHHIQRLMVLGLFGMQLGVDPRQMNAWHEAFYIDAWEWVSMPNMIGMSQYADGGVVGTKPYAASGNYVNRMSNYCKHCRYDPGTATGEDACPFTTLYWDFLARHREAFGNNRRMNFQMANLRRKGEDAVTAIRDHAETVRERAADGTL